MLSKRLQKKIFFAAKDFHQKLFFGRKKVTSLNKKKQTRAYFFFGFCSDRCLGLGSVFLSSLTVSNKAHRKLNVVAYQSPAVLKGRIKNAPPLSLGIRSLSNERVPPLASFADINFRPTNPKIFLKAPWAPIYINFQG